MVACEARFQDLQEDTAGSLDLCTDGGDNLALPQRGGDWAAARHLEADGELFQLGAWGGTVGHGLCSGLSALM